MIFIILAMFLYTLATMFGAAASRHLDSRVGTIVVMLASTVIPSLVVIPALLGKATKNDSFGIWMAVMSGLSVSVFSLVLLKAFSQNKVGIVVPVVFGGAIFLSTILSFIIFKQKITLVQSVGLTFLAFGFSAIIYAQATGK